MRIIRTLALSGAAAAALLASPALMNSAAAAEDEHGAVRVADQEATRATGAPVNLPSGRTIRVPGLDTVGYRAEGAHHDAVVQLAEGGGQGGGAGAAPQQQNQDPFPAGQNTPSQQQQIRTQASGGSISIATAVGLGLLIVVIYAGRNGKIKWGWAVMCIALGVYLTPTVVGPLVTQLGGSLGQSLGNVWGGL